MRFSDLIKVEGPANMDMQCTCAQALYNSPEYKAAQAIGDKYATFRRYAVEGLPQ
jgi:uncharacterized protein (DUF1330 family)